MDFRWQLAIGDDTLTDDEIDALAETKAPLVRLRGQWVAVDPEQLRRGLEFLEREPAVARTAAEMLALAASHPDDLDTPLPVTGVGPTAGWANCWPAQRHSRWRRSTRRPGSKPPCGPTSSAGCPGWRSCRRWGSGPAWPTTWGWARRCSCSHWSPCTVTAHPDAGPTLLLCPMSLVGNWQREAAKFAPELRVYAHHGERAACGRRAARTAPGPT